MKSIPRCATCEHWSPQQIVPDGHEPNPPLGYGICSKIFAMDSVDRERRLAVIGSGECYGEQLETKPEFGCVLHSALETP